MYTEPDHPAVAAYDETVDFEDDNFDAADYLAAKAIYFHEHPVPAPEGFHLVDCDAQPRHPAIYEMVDHDFYGMPCHYCVGEAQQDEFRRLEKETHWVRHPIRWWWFKYVDRALARIGIDTMYSYVISHTCHGCCLNITFRRHRTGT